MFLFHNEILNDIHIQQNLFIASNWHEFSIEKNNNDNIRKPRAIVLACAYARYVYLTPPPKSYHIIYVYA